MQELHPYIQHSHNHAITRVLVLPVSSLGLTARQLGELWLTIAMTILIGIFSESMVIWLATTVMAVLALTREGTKQPVFETGRQVRAPPTTPKGYGAKEEKKSSYCPG